MDLAQDIFVKNEDIQETPIDKSDENINLAQDEVLKNTTTFNTEKYVKWAKKLNQIGIALSSEKNILKLLEMILSESREFTNCDAGTFYRVSKNKKFLNFTVMHNDTFKEYSGGTSGIVPSLPPVPLFNDSDELNHSNVSAYVALTGKTVNIKDAYQEEGFDFEGTKTVMS